MATLHFASTDFKVFTPISSVLANLPNGSGTMMVLVKQTATGGQDFCGLLNSAATLWYHGLTSTDTVLQPPVNRLHDDDGIHGTHSTTAFSNTTDWFWFAIDWPANSIGVAERYHWRDQTTLSSWTHETSSDVNGGNRAGPGTSAWFRLGYIADFNTGTKDMAICAVWSGMQFADSDYGLWTKTSDLYNHVRGRPTFLAELNAATLSDLMGGSTYSSANSSGTALTGANPSNWTFDGVGSAPDNTTKPGIAGMFTPQLRQDAWF